MRILGNNLKTLSLFAVAVMCMCSVAAFTDVSNDSDAATYSDLGTYYSSGVNQSTSSKLYSGILSSTSDLNCSTAGWYVAVGSFVSIANDSFYYINDSFNDYGLVMDGSGGGYGSLYGTLSKAGTISITCYSETGGSNYTLKIVGVDVPMVTSISLSPSGDQTLAVGDTLSVTVTTNSDAFKRGVSFKSSNPSVVSVSYNTSSTGGTATLTAKAKGTATITATSLDMNTSESFNVTVPDPNAVTGITLSKSSTYVDVGGSIKITASVTPSTATNSGVSFSVSPSTYATIVDNGDNTATLYGVKKGTVTVTATAKDGSGTTGTISVSVRNNFSLTYDGNGGQMTSVTQRSGSTTATSYTFTVTTIAPVLSGYAFLGWAESDDATDPAYQPGDSFTTTELENTLYAVWGTYTYIFVFNPNGGSGGPTSPQTYGGKTSSSFSIDVPAGTPILSGYTFLGWSESDSATSPTYTVGGSAITVTASGSTTTKTLYAVWQLDVKYTYTLGFDANGGSGAPASISSGEVSATSYTFTIPSATPVWANHTFKGWSESATGSVIGGRTVTLTSPQTSKTLYAIWEVDPKNTFAIEYNVNGGSGSVTGSTHSSYDSTHDFTVTSSIPTAPSGKEFRGWSTNSAGAVEKVSGDVVTCAANSTVTLYAIYGDIKYTYTIVYNANGGTDAPANTVGTSTGLFMDLMVTSERPTYAGMVFLGWDPDGTSETASLREGDQVRVTGTTTLYAIWRIAEITISGTPSVTSVATGTAWSFTPTVSVPDASLSVRGATWLSVVDGKVVGTPTVAGTYNVTVTASKGGYSSASTSFTITVVPVLSFDSLPIGGAIAYAA